MTCVAVPPLSGGGDLEALRELLRARFPRARVSGPGDEGDVGGGLFPRGALCEVVAPHGAARVVSAVLGDGNDAVPVVLIDPADAFDPASHGSKACRHLLWLRARGPAPSLRAADLLLRDGHFPWVLLDWSGLEPGMLRRIPAGSWHRLHSLARAVGARFLAMTPAPMVPKPARRYFQHSELALADLDAGPEAWRLSLGGLLSGAMEHTASGG